MIDWKKYIWNESDDLIVSLADQNKIKKDCPFAVIPKALCWMRDSNKNKLLSILKLNYDPNDELIQNLANEISIDEIF